VTITRTAVAHLRRQIELAEEVLSGSDPFATNHPATVRHAMTLAAQLEHEIEDMRLELAELEGTPSGAVSRSR
jgi:hypothetical protein